MELLKFPDKSLFNACKEVTVFGEELKILLDGMWSVMLKGGGLGLASNQVGLDHRMFVMAGPDNEKIFLINPQIIQRSEQPANIREGCLSAPGEFLLLNERVFWVQVYFKDEKGAQHMRVFKGLHSVCVQHEIDHLDGKSHLMSKSIPKAQRKQLYKKWGLKSNL
jgi:peptide deformylase